METPISIRSATEVCENVQRQEKFEQEIIQKLFKRYVNENVIIFINQKHLPDLMDKRFYGCKNGRASQRDHHCLMITTKSDLAFIFF